MRIRRLQKEVTVTVVYCDVHEEPSKIAELSGNLIAKSGIFNIQKKRSPVRIVRVNQAALTLIVPVLPPEKTIVYEIFIRYN
jgi:hypothetical protein